MLLLVNSHHHDLLVRIFQSCSCYPCHTPVNIGPLPITRVFPESVERVSDFDSFRTSTGSFSDDIFLTVSISRPLQQARGLLSKLDLIDIALACHFRLFCTP